jgi:hypothetical protein
MTRIHKITWAYNFACFSVHCYMHNWLWSAVNNIYAPTEAVFIMKVLYKCYSLLCSLVDGQQHVRETCQTKPLSEEGSRKLLWNIGTNLPNHATVSTLTTLWVFSLTRCCCSHAVGLYVHLFFVSFFSFSLINIMFPENIDYIEIKQISLEHGCPTHKLPRLLCGLWINL